MNKQKLTRIKKEERKNMHKDKLRAHSSLTIPEQEYLIHGNRLGRSE